MNKDLKKEYAKRRAEGLYTCLADDTECYPRNLLVAESDDKLFKPRKIQNEQAVSITATCLLFQNGGLSDV